MMVIVKVSRTVTIPFVAVMGYLVITEAAVGVPVTAPVASFNNSPGGREPEKLVGLQPVSVVMLGAMEEFTRYTAGLTA